MSTDPATVPKSELAITPDQTEFTHVQRKALEHLGVDDAADEDLKVYFHQIQRTGLDPFIGQIHMIGRRSSVYDPQTNEKTWKTKYTIQTGIDGFRLIGRRAADQAQETISMDAAEWLADDGTWRPAWSNKWGLPIAARVKIYRNAQPFTAVAMFDEYAQRTRNGGLTQMWQQRPAGQLAKCAEALAWRMAFPQDLAGMYTTDEMQQANNSDTQLGYKARAEQQAQQETQDQAAFEKSAQDSINAVWDDLAGLEELGRWATNNNWPTGHVNKIRARWQELNNQQPKDDIVDAEVIDEPEK